MHASRLDLDNISPTQVCLTSEFRGCGRRGRPLAFDLLHLDGHDLRSCPIKNRKALLRIVYVDHMTGRGAELFEHASDRGRGRRLQAARLRLPRRPNATLAM